MCIQLFRYILLVASGTNYHRCKLWGMRENPICKRVWRARVTMAISKVILCRVYFGVIYKGVVVV